MTLFFQGLEAEHHVVGGHLCAVGKPRLFAQEERDRHLVLGDLGGMRHQAVNRIRLVERPGHQGVEQRAKALRRVALEDIRVEAAEGGEAAGADHRQPSALRRLRVHIGEVGEVGRILEIAKRRQAVHRLTCCRGGQYRRKCHGGQEVPEGLHGSNFNLADRATSYLSSRAFALASSYHQVERKLNP